MVFFVFWLFHNAMYAFLSFILIDLIILIMFGKARHYVAFSFGPDTLFSSMGASRCGDMGTTLLDSKLKCIYLGKKFESTSVFTKQVSAILITFLQYSADNKTMIILSYLKTTDKLMNYLKIPGGLVN
jgi:hypothetical protein